VDAVWFIGAVLETASLRSPALIEREGIKILRSRCLGERTRPMHQASSSGAEREAVVARHPGKVGSVGSRSSKAEDSPPCAAAGMHRKECRRQAPCKLAQPIAGKPLKQRQCASSSAGSRPGPFGSALPNPSLKPSPNSKPPGRRYSAGLHFLQRRPGVSLLVPA